LIVSYLNWRWTFFIFGSVGFLWALIWLKFYHPPATNPLITSTERALIAHALTIAAATRPTEPTATIRWRDLFRYREVLGLMTAKFLTDSAWYFFIFWLPKYLSDIRHLDIKAIGYFAWIPYGFSGAGSLIGGAFSALLIKRGMPLDRARKIALACAALLMPASLFITASPLSLAIVFFSMAMFAHQFWSANIQTLPADLFPSKIVGSVEGLLGSAGAFGGMLFGQLVAYFVENGGYTIPFVFAGILHPIAFLVIVVTVRRIERLRS
jgi:ACS family hexuronate transporter-like MFS transporter